MTETITAKQLEELGASPAQVDAFRKLFGAESEVTRENLLRAAASLNIEWAVANLWPDLRDEYERQVEPLWAEYDRQVEPLWAEYELQVATLIADLLELPR